MDIFVLDLLILYLLLFTAGISLQNCHKLPDVFEQLKLYSIKLYIGITISIYSASFSWVLFVLLMQLVNRKQFLNITFLLILFTAAPAAAVLLTDIFP